MIVFNFKLSILTDEISNLEGINLEGIELNNIHGSEIYYYLLYGNIADNIGKVNLNISDEFKDKLVEICSNYIGKVLTKYTEIIEYNQIGSNDGEIEVLNLNVSPYNEYYSQEWFDDLEVLYTNTDENIEDFTYFIIKVTIDNKDIYLFRKPQKPKAIKKKFILRKVGREYVIDDSNLIIFDDDIDFIVYQNKMYIFKHHSVDAAFNMTSIYRQKSREILSASIIEEKIDNYEQLKDDIENNISFMKRVSKLETSEHKFLFRKFQV